MRPAGEARISVYVWDPVVRITHWVVVFAILGLSATGFYLGAPFAAPGEHPFFTGWVRVVHLYAAVAFTVAVFARVLWMFLGPPWARWSQFIPTSRQRLRDFGRTLQFYLFLRRDPPPCVGHNPVAGAAYTAIFGIYLVMILTGLALWAPASMSLGFFAFLGPLFGGLQNARWIHHVGMWLLLVFMVQHVYSSWLMSRMERNATLDSIFTGFKALPPPGEDEKHA